MRFNEQHNHVEYDAGKLVSLWVLICVPGLAENFICQYVGPYNVLRRMSPVTYVVEPVAL